MTELRYGIWSPVGANFDPLNTLDEPIDASRVLLTHTLHPGLIP